MRQGELIFSYFCGVLILVFFANVSATICSTANLCSIFGIPFSVWFLLGIILWSRIFYDTLRQFRKSRRCR